MFRFLSDDALVQIASKLDMTAWAWNQLMQAKRRQRGAWIKPGLSPTVHQLEKALLESYFRLARDLIASLRGASDDISSGRLHQAKQRPIREAEIADVIDYFALTEDEADQPVDRARLAGLLMLIGLWLARHQRIAEEYARIIFDQGREKAIKEAGKVSIAAGPISSQLKQAVLSRYEKDIERLRTDLQSGTSRSDGIEWIIQNSANLGIAALYLKRLFETEAFRIGMLSEALAWTSLGDGYRAGAVEATQAILKEEGLWKEGLTAAALSESQLETISSYEFVGPDDERTCSACVDQLSKPFVYAFSLEDLPSPYSICLYGINCRHDWEVSE